MNLLFVVCEGLTETFTYHPLPKRLWLIFLSLFFFLVSCIRGQRLEESLEYQQFVANVEEEEAWINEKMTLVASEDYGDTLVAIQVRENLKMPPAFPVKSCLWFIIFLLVC